MSDFEKVAKAMAGRVGAPWSGGVSRPGVAGATMTFPGGPGVITPEQTIYRGNSYFGLESLTAADNVIPAGATRTLERKPQRSFIPLQFMAPSYIDDLLIVALNINNTNFLANGPTAGMRMSLLSEVSQAMGILWKKISVSSGITIALFNPTAADISFSGAFAGIQLDEE